MPSDCEAGHAITIAERTITESLERAFDGAANLPPSDQVAIAAWLLAELESERRWEESFARSEDFLERLAEEVLVEERTCQTGRLHSRLK